MTINTTMPKGLIPYYHKELETYREKMSSGYFKEAWRYLERAHILGQPYPYQHSEVHWMMLKFGIEIKSTKEIFGQIPRLFVGGVKSFVSFVPVGNTGGADVHPLKSMPIEKDIQAIIEKAKMEENNASI
jgi:hypothetical protein